jgi:hypothetical protein
LEKFHKYIFPSFFLSLADWGDLINLFRIAPNGKDKTAVLIDGTVVTVTLRAHLFLS